MIQTDYIDITVIFYSLSYFVINLVFFFLFQQTLTRYMCVCDCVCARMCVRCACKWLLNFFRVSTICVCDFCLFCFAKVNL